METTPNSMYNELFATPSDRFQYVLGACLNGRDRNGPLIPLDQPRSGAGARLSFALSFSPTQKQSPTDSDFLRSPLYFGEVRNPLLLKSIDAILWLSSGLSH